ncbi:MAG TPA: RNA polymerase factor sigma-54 [Ktedonobacterales bacterium]
MYLEQAQLPGTQQSLTISAKLIASIKILQCSAEELEQSIARELSENPALEVDELAQCQRCGSPLRSGLCPTCDRSRNDDADPRRDLANWDDDGPIHSVDLAVGEDSDYDPLDFVRTGATLHDHLMRQLCAIIDDMDEPIAEYLVGSLNSHGYVTVSPAEVAETLRIPEVRVDAVLAALQTLDPPGIGARNLRECLLIQLHTFEEQGKVPPAARLLLESHLVALGERHFADIAREIGVSSTQVKQAWRFIRSNLNPYPAHTFESADVPDIGLTLGSERSVLVRPDVVIRRTEHGFEAEIVEQRRFRFDINSLYSQLYRQNRTAAARSAINEQDRQHVRQYATRARFFMDCIRQRWETLSLIANALIEFQHDFLEQGVRHLRPLTRGELANHVGLHESTVSRATANKYVLLPSGRTIPFDDFFDGSLAAKDMLREFITSEDAKKPYSDEDLAALLHEHGLPLARRTVAKYREAIGILPSRFRI